MSRIDKELAEILAPAEQPPILTVVPKPKPQKPALAHWERCKGWIAEGLGDDALITLADIEVQIGAGTAILWPGKAAAIVSEFVTYPSGDRAAQVMSAGGDLDEILAMVPGMEAFARLNDCTVVTIEGRRGWEKVMKPSGYGFWAVTLRKKL